MPSWAELVEQFAQQQAAGTSTDWLNAQILASLRGVSAASGNRCVVLYASAFLQKGAAVPANYVSVSSEDINGLMATLHGLDCSRGLTLILHTPGGEIAGAENIVSYLHSKFADIETIIPTYAMSAGTMMALGSNRIVMGRQSQLGPIDAQIFTGARMVSAGAVLSQFAEARADILVDGRRAAIWAPILQSMGPALQQEAKYALEFGQGMVKKWLESHMFKGRPDAKNHAEKVAEYFNTTDNHKQHDRRIDRDEARGQGLDIQDLEGNQAFQDVVLTLYHLITMLFETSTTTKIWINQNGRAWIKHFQP
jgi:ClpP class serine protease